jgi:uncharacterized protein
VTSGEIRVTVRLTPRGGADRVDGVDAGVLRVRVSAAPADGAANESLLRLLASELGVSRSRVRLVSGATSRRKIVAIDGISRVRLAARWPALGIGPAATSRSGDPR